MEENLPARVQALEEQLAIIRQDMTIFAGEAMFASLILPPCLEIMRAQGTLPTEALTLLLDAAQTSLEREREALGSAGKQAVDHARMRLESTIRHFRKFL